MEGGFAHCGLGSKSKTVRMDSIHLVEDVAVRRSMKAVVRRDSDWDSLGCQHDSGKWWR